MLHGLEIKEKDENKHQNSSEESREVKNNDTGVNCVLSKVNQIISMCGTCKSIVQTVRHCRGNMGHA